MCSLNINNPSFKGEITCWYDLGHPRIKLTDQSSDDKLKRAFLELDCKGMNSRRGMNQLNTLLTMLDISDLIRKRLNKWQKDLSIKVDRSSGFNASLYFTNDPEKKLLEFKC